MSHINTELGQIAYVHLRSPHHVSRDCDAHSDANIFPHSLIARVDYKTCEKHTRKGWAQTGNEFIKIAMLYTYVARPEIMFQHSILLNFPVYPFTHIFSVQQQQLWNFQPHILSLIALTSQFENIKTDALSSQPMRRQTFPKFLDQKHFSLDQSEDEHKISLENFSRPIRERT